MAGHNPSRWEVCAHVAVYALLGATHHDAIGSLLYGTLSILALWAMKRK